MTRRARSRSGPWYRRRPKTFGLVVMGGFLLVAVLVASLTAMGLRHRDQLQTFFLHGVGALLAIRWIYLGASRWADPSLAVTFEQHEQGYANVGGERVHVSVATGSKTARISRRFAIGTILFGLAFWILPAGFTLAASRGWIGGSDDGREAPTPSRVVPVGPPGPAPSTP